MASVVLPGTGMPDINHGPAILASCGVVTAIALTAVLMRMYVRIYMIKAMSWDDYVIVISMILSFSGMMVVIPEVAYGAGRHVVYIGSMSDVVNGLRLNFITQPIYLLAISSIKVSIGLFLLRFAPSKAYVRFIWAVQALLLAYTTVGFVTILTQCRPLSIIWNYTVTAVCFSMETLQTLAYVNASLGIATDLIFAILPIPMLWHVQVNTRVKVALFAIMSLGIFASAASIVKLYYITSYGLTGDFLYDSTNLTIWTCVECNVGILAASIPCLKPLFRAMLMSSAYGREYYNNNNNNNHNAGSRSKPNTRGYAQQSGNGEVSNNEYLDVARKHRSRSGDEFEMYSSKSGTFVTAARSDKGSDNISEESILPLQSNGPSIGMAMSRGIIKTTQVQVSTTHPDEEMRRSVEDRV